MCQQYLDRIYQWICSNAGNSCCPVRDGELKSMYYGTATEYDWATSKKSAIGAQLLRKPLVASVQEAFQLLLSYGEKAPRHAPGDGGYDADDEEGDERNSTDDASGCEGPHMYLLSCTPHRHTSPSSWSSSDADIELTVFSGSVGRNLASCNSALEPCREVYTVDSDSSWLVLDSDFY